jgi:hypothetical protein
LRISTQTTSRIVAKPGRSSDQLKTRRGEEKRAVRNGGAQCTTKGGAVVAAPRSASGMPKGVSLGRLASEAGAQPQGAKGEEAGEGRRVD